MTEKEISFKYSNIEDKITCMWKSFAEAGEELKKDIIDIYNIKDVELIRVISLIRLRANIILDEHIDSKFVFAGLYPEKQKLYDILPEIFDETTGKMIKSLADTSVGASEFRKYQLIAAHIDKLLATAIDETGGSSVIHHKMKNKSFLELVAMGDIIVDYVFKKMFEEGTDWIHLLLLREIVKDGPEIPKEHLGNFDYLIVDWMQWYVKSAYFLNNDIYYNLI